MTLFVWFGGVCSGVGVTIFCSYIFNGLGPGSPWIAILIMVYGIGWPVLVSRIRGLK
jgi:hypothetical protein